MRARVLLLCLGAVMLMHAQAPQRFYTRFGGDGDDIAYSGKQTNDKQYIIAGSSSSYGVAGNTDVYLVKVDSMGFPIWQKFFGGSQNDIGRSVIQLADSGFVVAGFTNSFGAGGYDVFVIRTDKNGNTKWQKTFGGTDWDFAYDVVQASDGNLFVVGNTSSFGNGKTDAYLLKIDLSGNLLLQKTYGGSENEELRSIIKTNDTNLATVGYTESYKDILGDHYFIKLDHNLDTLIVKKYGNSGKSYLNDLVQDVTGDYILVGAETYTNLPFTQSYRASVNSSFSQFNWEGNSFTSDDEESWTSITRSIAGSSRVSTLRNFYKNGFKKQGSVFSNTPSSFYPSIVNEFGGGEDEQMFSNDGTRDGGFVCFGSTKSFASLGKDIYLMKMDSMIINYSSVVNLNEIKTKNDIVLIKKYDSHVQCVFDSEKLPYLIEISDESGRLLNRIFNHSPSIKIESELLRNSICIFKFIYQDNSIITKKLLIQ